MCWQCIQHTATSYTSYTPHRPPWLTAPEPARDHLEDDSTSIERDCAVRGAYRDYFHARPNMHTQFFLSSHIVIWAECHNRNHAHKHGSKYSAIHSAANAPLVIPRFSHPNLLQAKYSPFKIFPYILTIDPVVEACNPRSQ